MDAIFDYISTNLGILPKQDLSFPYSDYGFLYGYGLFETIKIQDGKPLLLEDHLTRLKESSIILDIPFLYEFSDITAHLSELIKKNSCDQAVLNIYLTPGNRGGDPAIHKITHPFFLMVLRKWPGYTNDMELVVDVREMSFQRTRMDRYKTLAWMKNCLEHRLSDNSDDVLLFDQDQIILEASRSNVFFIKDSTLISPISNLILNGVTRNFVCKHAQDFGYELQERQVFLDEIPFFDEVFFTNSLRGIALVKSLGEFSLTSGAKTAQLQRDFVALLAS